MVFTRAAMLMAVAVVVLGWTCSPSGGSGTGGGSGGAATGGGATGGGSGGGATGGSATGGGSGGSATGGGSGGGQDAGPTVTGTLTTKATIALPGFPTSLAFNSASKKAYFGCTSRNDAGITNSAGIAVVDDATATVVATIPTWSIAGVLAANPTNNKVYFGEYKKVAVIDGTTNQISANRIALDAGSEIAGMAFDATHDKLYVLSTVYTPQGGVVHVIDGASNAVTATWSVPVMPITGDMSLGNHMIAVDPATQKVFVLGSDSAYHSATVTIDGTTGTVSAPVSYPSYGIGGGSTVEVFGSGNAVVTLIGGSPNAVQFVDPVLVKLPAGFTPDSMVVVGPSANIFGYDAAGKFMMLTVDASGLVMIVTLTMPNGLFGDSIFGSLMAATGVTDTFYVTTWPDPVSGGPTGPSSVQRVEIKLVH